MARLKDKPFTEKYRPRSVAALILPEQLKKELALIVSEPAPPPLIFAGRAGIGKTSAALAIIDEKDAEYFFVNGSKERNIDTLRNEMTGFASSMAFNGRRKYIVIDEADNLNAQSTQPALRSFMEEYATNCGFILTCNYPNKLIEPLRDSRCRIVHFTIPKKDKLALMEEQMNRIEEILNLEGIGYEENDLPELVTRFFPDYRRTLTEVQYLSMSGHLDYQGKTLQDDYKALANALKKRSFNEAQKWLLSNIDADFTGIIRLIYDNMKDLLANQSIPVAIMIMSKFDYERAFVSDIEIHTMAMFMHLMSDCEFK